MNIPVGFVTRLSVAAMKLCLATYYLPTAPVRITKAMYKIYWVIIGT